VIWNGWPSATSRLSVFSSTTLTLNVVSLVPEGPVARNVTEYTPALS
jgi:hypothetical protein